MYTLGKNTNAPIILISDDEPDTLNLLTNIYKRQYNVVSAQSGKETLDIFQKLPIDLILLDAKMPDMDGFSVCQKLRNGYSHNYVHRPYVMMMTAYYTDEFIDKAFDVGVDDYIRKPLNVKILERRIKAILERKILQDTLMDSELKLKTIFDNANDGIIITDIETKKLLTVNNKICQMTGFSNEELLSMNIMDIHLKEDAPMILAKFDMQVTNKGTLLEAVPIRRKDGTIFYADINISPIILNNKQYVVGFFRDMTKRLILLNELGAHKNSLEDLVSQRTIELNESLMKLRFIIDSITKAMAHTVEAKDPYTAGHQKHVSEIARKIANKMGLPKDQVEGIRVAGVLHDLGKIQVPSEILSKPAKLNEFEFGLIHMHSNTGYTILNGIDFPWPIADIVRQHHERIDGSGYPLGLKKEEILIESKILSVADVYDAMVTHRPYRAALGRDAALNEIQKNKGILYDSVIVDAFEETINDKDFYLSDNSIDL
ncbi:MAG: response regulator [Nitrospirae bacterium]|nr:response regulator [Nitrospirota bacterium]MBF0539868.1 response regulator [Nitrospirota bacterium]